MPKLIHIVDRFDVPWSGSAIGALELYRRLQAHAEVRLWSDVPPHASYRGLPIESTGAGKAPEGGTLILFGGWYQPESWLESGGFERMVIKFNVFAYADLFRLIGRIRSAGLPEPEFVFPSAMLRDRVALDGLIEPSTVALEKFRVADADDGRPFTIGRHSRDTELKHHEDDPSLYRMLALQGQQIRIMGGTCLATHLGADTAGIELLAAGAMPVPQFLRGIDCFFYRTYPIWLEAFGRVVFEAMACGIPVVCERRGGYVDWIRDGDNGLLFSTQEEAYALLSRLSGDPGLRRRIGDAGRRTAESMYGAEAQQRFLDWYLGT